jgi:hypothetical protein
MTKVPTCRDSLARKSNVMWEMSDYRVRGSHECKTKQKIRRLFQQPHSPCFLPGGDLSQLKPKTVKLRFTLQNARLYSFILTRISHHLNRDKRTEF